mmetsp:Transcript_25435/g.36512  ORF Transcript_25435/g.36512 Transcript_25435/m.36512 type:complete len:381 (+) Transcript_25435:12-1154(+)
MFIHIRAILFLSLISYCFGILICENGFFCVSDEDCPIGNHCVEFVDGIRNLTRCVPRDDLDDNYLCSLSHKSCDVLPCCSGLCDSNKHCRPLLPPNCILPTQFMSELSSNSKSKGAFDSAQDKKKKPQVTKLPSGNPTLRSSFWPSLPNPSASLQPSIAPVVATSKYPSKRPISPPIKHKPSKPHKKPKPSRPFAASTIFPSSSSIVPSYFPCSNCSSCGAYANTTIPSQVSYIPGWAFFGCSSITSILIPTTVTEMGTGVFYSCTSLTSITIPTSMTTISVAAFYSCTSITTITISTSVNIIGIAAFASCTSLTSIIIPTSVNTIRTGAFQYCYSLTSVTIPTTVTVIISNAFADCTSLTCRVITGNPIVYGAFEDDTC